MAAWRKKRGREGERDGSGDSMRMSVSCGECWPQSKCKSWMWKGLTSSPPLEKGEEEEEEEEGEGEEEEEGEGEGVEGNVSLGELKLFTISMIFAVTT